jgi:hypothetical protein
MSPLAARPVAPRMSAPGLPSVVRVFALVVTLSALVSVGTTAFATGPSTDELRTDGASEVAGRLRPAATHRGQRPAAAGPHRTARHGRQRT